MSTADLFAQFLEDSSDDASFDPDAPPSDPGSEAPRMEDTLPEELSEEDFPVGGTAPQGQDGDGMGGDLFDDEMDDFLDRDQEEDDFDQGPVDPRRGVFDEGERRESETEDEYDARLNRVRWQKYQFKKDQIERDVMVYISDIAKHHTAMRGMGLGSKRVDQLVLSPEVVGYAKDLLEATKQFEVDDITPDNVPGFTAEMVLLNPSLQCYKKALFPLWDAAVNKVHYECLLILIAIFNRMLKQHPATVTPEGVGFLTDDVKKSKGSTFRTLKNYYDWACAFKAEVTVRESFYRGLGYFLSVIKFKEDNQGYSSEQLEIKVMIEEKLLLIQAEPPPSPEDMVELAVNALLNDEGRLLFVKNRLTGESIEDDSYTTARSEELSYAQYLINKDDSRVRLRMYTRSEVVGFLKLRLDRMKDKIDSSYRLIRGTVCLSANETYMAMIRGLLALPAHDMATGLSQYGIRNIQSHLATRLLSDGLLLPIEKDAEELFQRGAVLRADRSGGSFPQPSDQARLWRVMDIIFYAITSLNTDDVAKLVYEPKEVRRVVAPAGPAAGPAAQKKASALASRFMLLDRKRKQAAAGHHSQFNAGNEMTKLFASRSQLEILTFKHDKAVGANRKGYHPKVLWKERLLFSPPAHFILDSDHHGGALKASEGSQLMDRKAKEAIVNFLHSFAFKSLDRFIEGWMEDSMGQMRALSAEVGFDQVLRFMALIGWLIRLGRKQISFIETHHKIVADYKKKLKEETDRRAVSQSQRDPSQRSRLAAGGGQASHVYRPEYSCSLLISGFLDRKRIKTTLEDDICHSVIEPTNAGETEEELERGRVSSICALAYYPIGKRLKPLLIGQANMFYMDFVTNSVLKMKKSDLPGPMAATALKVITEALDTSFQMMTVKHGKLIADLGVRTMEELLRFGVAVVVPELLKSYSMQQHHPGLLAGSLRILKLLGEHKASLATYGKPEYAPKTAKRTELFKAMRNKNFHPLKKETYAGFSANATLQTFHFKDTLEVLSHEKIQSILFKAFELYKHHSEAFNDALVYILERLFSRRGEAHPEDGCLFLTLPWLVRCQAFCSSKDLPKSDPIYKFSLKVIQLFWKVFHINKLVLVESLYSKRTSRLDKPMNLGCSAHLESLYYAYTRGADHEAIEAGGTGFGEGGGGDGDAPVRQRRQLNLAPFTPDENKQLINAWQAARNEPTIAATLAALHRGQRWKRPKRQLRERLMQLGILEPMDVQAEDTGMAVRLQNAIEILKFAVLPLVGSHPAYNASTRRAVEDWLNAQEDIIIDEAGLSIASRVLLRTLRGCVEAIDDALSSAGARPGGPPSLRGLPAVLRVELRHLNHGVQAVLECLSAENEKEMIKKANDRPPASMIPLMGLADTPLLPATLQNQRARQLSMVLTTLADKIEPMQLGEVDEMTRLSREIAHIETEVEQNRFISEACTLPRTLRPDLIQALVTLREDASADNDFFYDFTKCIQDTLKEALLKRLSYLKKFFGSFAKAPSELMTEVEGAAVLGGGALGYAEAKKMDKPSLIFEMKDEWLGRDPTSYETLTQCLYAVGYYPVNGPYKKYLHSMDGQLPADAYGSNPSRPKLWRMSPMISIQTIQFARTQLDRLRSYQPAELQRMVQDPEGYAYETIEKSHRRPDEARRGEEEEEEEAPAAAEPRAKRPGRPLNHIQVASVLKTLLIVRRKCHSGDIPPAVETWLRDELHPELQRWAESSGSDPLTYQYVTEEDEMNGEDVVADSANSRFLRLIPVERLLQALKGLNLTERGQWRFDTDREDNKPKKLIETLRIGLGIELNDLKRLLKRFDRLEPGQDEEFEMECEAMFDMNVDPPGEGAPETTADTAEPEASAPPTREAPEATMPDDDFLEEEGPQKRTRVEFEEPTQGAPEPPVQTQGARTQDHPPTRDGTQERTQERTTQPPRTQPQAPAPRPQPKNRQGASTKRVDMDEPFKLDFTDHAKDVSEAFLADIFAAETFRERRRQKMDHLDRLLKLQEAVIL